MPVKRTPFLKHHEKEFFFYIIVTKMTLNQLSFFKSDFRVIDAKQKDELYLRFNFTRDPLIIAYAGK